MQGSPIDVRMTRRGHSSSETYRNSPLSFTSPPLSFSSDTPSFPQLNSAMTTNQSAKSQHRLSSIRSHRKSSAKEHKPSDNLLGVSPLSGGEVLSTSASTATSGDDGDNGLGRNSAASFIVGSSAKPAYMTRYGNTQGRNKSAIQDTMAWMEGVTRLTSDPPIEDDVSVVNASVEPSSTNDLTQFRLGEEFSHCAKQYSSRISFEKVCSS